MNTNFVKLLKYSRTPNLDQKNLSQIQKQLLLWQNNCNDNLFNHIDYEYLIYIEHKYSDCLDIQNLIKTLKNKIAINYENRQRLIQRLMLNREILDGQ